jgi:hypothetical protein
MRIAVCHGNRAGLLQRPHIADIACFHERVDRVGLVVPGLPKM